MLEYLKELLTDIKIVENEVLPTTIIMKAHQKVLALETAIEILEKLKNNERSVFKWQH